MWGKLRRQEKIFLGLLLSFGTFLQSSIMFRSGLFYPFGMGFWGPNAHDGIWHVALATQVLKGFPPPHPTFAGSLLTNYHYLYDLLLALASQITHLSASLLNFQIFPVLLSFLLGYFSFLIGSKIGKSFWTGFWFAFLNYFAGSLGFLVTLHRGQGLGGESLFWSMQSISTLINPPLALSFVMVLVGLNALISIKKYKPWQIILVSLLFGLLIDAKVYAAIIIFPGLAVFAYLKWKQAEKAPAQIFALSSLIAGLTYILINKESGSLVVFEPFWFIHTMIEAQDRLYIPNMALARYTLVEGGGYKRLIMIETIGFFLFVIGNMGTRIFGLWTVLTRKIRKEIAPVEWFFLLGGFIGLLMPTFFIQKGTSWNTIQFFYYSLFFANFYLAFFLTKLMAGKRFFLIRFLGLIFVIALTIPTTISSLPQYFGYPPPNSIPTKEVEALNFLSTQHPDIVLTFPFAPYAARGLATPIPVYLNNPSSYVTAYSGQITYMAEETNLDISGYNWAERTKEVSTFFGLKDRELARGFLHGRKIGYIYLVGKQELPINDLDLSVKEIFNNGEVRIYRVI